MKTKYSTENYEIIVDADPTNKGETVVYTILNKEYGVIEYADNILPRTIEAMHNFQDKLDELNAIENTPKLTPSGTAEIISIN
jgi:hypothetical protein